MTGAARRTAVVIGVMSVALMLAACSGSGTPSLKTSARIMPERVVRAPKRILAATVPQSNGIILGARGRA